MCLQLFQHVTFSICYWINKLLHWIFCQHLLQCVVFLAAKTHVLFVTWREKFEDIKGVIKWSEVVNQRRADNTMSKIKRKKEQTAIYKTSHRKLKIEQHQPPLKTVGGLRWSGRVSNLCTTYYTRRVTVKRHELHLIWKSCWTPVYVNKCR